MKVENQGEGTYRYECRKQDCWHCELMGLKPLPELDLNGYTVTKPAVQKQFQRRSVKHWTDRGGGMYPA